MAQSNRSLREPGKSEGANAPALARPLLPRVPETPKQRFAIFPPWAEQLPLFTETPVYFLTFDAFRAEQRHRVVCVERILPAGIAVLSCSGPRPCT